MATEIVRATYAEQSAIETFLTSVFGEGNATVKLRNSLRMFQRCKKAGHTVETWQVPLYPPKKPYRVKGRKGKDGGNGERGTL
ncbi:uncharacterized protein FTJAE_11461 [Fusarium tjaetaba]|uniref:Uncharacterized protein n=1 Tax=Fusarium tjaetaba TaxID=1567544 RepID=A0A8H5QTY9_9HYPO|nr:uncharacterized protein FTJAE_11461 [Fusarium tjaetaba]KAF5621120.1 hypothetical protein FTJAE_11461 [Fusarium tjaetaba]